MIRNIAVRKSESAPMADTITESISPKKSKAEQNTVRTTILSGHEEYRFPTVNPRPSKVPPPCIVSLKATTIIKNALDFQI